MDASVAARSAMIGDTAEEEDEVEDAGTTTAPARSGATSLGRIAGRTSLARTALRATLASLYCGHHQEGTMTTIRTRWPGASRNRAP